jgi:vacuolar-type H+-ATPase subunit H
MKLRAIGICTALALAPVLGACSDDDGDDAVDETSQTIDESADEAQDSGGDAVDDARDAAEDAIDDAGETIDEGLARTRAEALRPASARRWATTTSAMLGRSS